MAAIELLLREGLGRPPQAEETAAPKLPATAAAVTSMGWDDLQILGATLFAEEIAAVEAGAGAELLHERLAHMSQETRQLLRVADSEKVGQLATGHGLVLLALGLSINLSAV